jgi:hypothetical protein
VATRLEAIHEKTDANHISVEPEMEHQKKKVAWIVDMTNDWKEMTACQDAVEANLEKLEQNLGAKGAVVERQKIPNEEDAIHSLRACQIERMVCQETMKANPERVEPTDRVIAILE